MMKYNSYKDSEIGWLGEIPASWKIDRIKNIGSVNGRVGWKALKASEYVDSGFFFLSTPNIKDVEIDFENVNYITAERYYESPEIMLKVGDILLVKDGSTLGIVNVVRHLPDKGTVNSSIAVLRIKQFHSIYGYYFLLSNYIQNVIQLKKDGMGVPHLFQRDINNFEIIIPSFEEQTAIAEYLDTKTQAIDKKVSLLEKKIGYYQELRKSLINETVTKGLDKNVKLKDSGIDWVGKIPEHWEMKRVKDLASRRKYYPIGDGDHGSIKPEMYLDRGIPYIRVQNLSWDGKVDFENIVYISQDVQNHNKKSRLTPNDILIAKTGATVGKLGIIPNEIEEANTTSSVGKVSVDERVCLPRFVLYAFMANHFQFTLWNIASQKSAQPGFNIDDLVLFNVVVPPMMEQVELANYLDSKLDTIAKIITNIQTQITTLKELRKTLINDVVTGKIKVIQD